MSNYSSMKLEVLALKWVVVEKFHEYLLGVKFVVFMDNNPLSYLQTAKLAAVAFGVTVGFVRFLVLFARKFSSK